MIRENGRTDALLCRDFFIRVVILASFLFCTAVLPVNAGVIVDNHYRWPKRYIPYLLDCRNAPVYACNLIDYTIKNVWNRQSPIEFREKSSDDRSYVDFIYNPDLQALGRSEIGYHGERVHFLEYREDVTLSVIIHEMGHVAGLLHEHTHCERDKFIRVLPQGLPPQKEFFRDEVAKFSCFAPVNNYGARMTKGGYNFKSIMHYPEINSDHIIIFNNLSHEGAKLLETEAQIPPGQIGIQRNLSDGDVNALRELYELN